MTHAIELRGLVKTFGDHRAVDGVDLSIPVEGIFGIIGPNGAGKSTTIRMVMDIIRPDEGSVTVLGRPAEETAKERVGYLPEERGIYRKMTALDFLTFQGTLKGLSRADARAAGRVWLKRLELLGWGDKKNEELSKGMQQKVQFAAAVMGSPELLILDEPTSGMDPVNQNLLRELIVELSRAGLTVVLSTHQMDLAENMCRGLAMFHKGKVVLNGTVSDIKERYGERSVQVAFDGDGAFLQELPGVLQLRDYGQYVELRLDEGAMPQGVLNAAAPRVSIRRFEVMTPTLHDIFLHQVEEPEAVDA